jgi:hypothetical protein
MNTSNKSLNLVDSANDFHKINSRETAISINNVEVSFSTPKGKFTAVKDISLDIKRGEIISNRSLWLWKINFDEYYFRYGIAYFRRSNRQR